MTIELPISKSIAQRLLILQALQGAPLLSVNAEVDAEDICVFRSALLSNEPHISVENNGTAMRFLTAYFAQKVGRDVVLDGCERMHERPIGQLVDALRELGADIEYLGAEGYPPLRIRGKELEHRKVCIRNPKSTQFISALMLIGADVETNIISPYIELTRSVVTKELPYDSCVVERDWSAAAFWLERWALGLCEMPEFPGLREDSMQGDRVARELFELLKEMGTSATSATSSASKSLSIDFTSIPDLYPAIAITCEQLGIRLTATGTDSLLIKESNRLEAIREHKTYGDHRIAMALLAADLDCDDVDCIRKSYPKFYEQLCASRQS